MRNLRLTVNGTIVNIDEASASELQALLSTPSTFQPAFDNHDLHRIATHIVAAGDRILAIKFVRQILNLGLREAKEWVDNRFPPVRT